MNKKIVPVRFALQFVLMMMVVFAAATVFAEMRVITKTGKVVRVPVRSSEISRIEIDETGQSAGGSTMGTPSGSASGSSAGSPMGTSAGSSSGSSAGSSMGYSGGSTTGSGSGSSAGSSSGSAMGSSAGSSSGSSAGSPMAASPRRYMGCFKDQGDPGGLTGRDMFGYLYRDQAMTIDKCISLCQQKGFIFAGMQSGTQCFCGQIFGRFGTSNNCNMRCPGSTGEICGGTWANSVYKTPLAK